MYEQYQNTTHSQEQIKTKLGRPSREEHLANKIKESQKRLKSEQEKLRQKLKEEEDKLKAKIKKEEEFINKQIKLAREATDKRVAAIVRKHWYSKEPFEELELLLEEILGEKV